MAPKSCLTKSDMALAESTVKAHPPVSSSKQKLIEKQEKMYYALNKNVDFQKNIGGLKRMDKITAIQKKYADNGVKITRKKIDQMMKNGVTIAKSPPITMPKPPIVAPGVPKPPPVIPKPPPKIVSIPKEPVLKIIPTEPVPKELLVEFKEAKTLEEALEEYKKYGHGNPMANKFARGWSKKKQLKTMNEINAQMNQMERWIRGRKLGKLDFIDGDQKLGGSAGTNKGMGFNHININYRRAFRKFGDREKGIGSLQRFRTVVSAGNSSVVLRHEMGHVLWYDDRSAIGSKLRLEFIEKYKGIKRAIVEQHISTYANTNVREFFAESFAIYSSPKYKMGTLNKIFGSGFEELMEKILKGGI